MRTSTGIVAFALNRRIACSSIARNSFTWSGAGMATSSRNNVPPSAA
jgi:hypothetical protein